MISSLKKVLQDDLHICIVTSIVEKLQNTTRITSHNPHYIHNGNLCMFDTLSGNNLQETIFSSRQTARASGYIMCRMYFLTFFAFNSHLPGSNCDVCLFWMLGTLALNISAHANRRSIDGGLLEVPYHRRSIAAIVASPPGPVLLPLRFPVLRL